MNRLLMNKAMCAGLMLILIVCTMTCLPSENISSSETSVPFAVPSIPSDNVQESPALTTAQPNPNIVFQDDFTNPGSGWTVFTNDFGEGKYENGGYFLKCVKPADFDSIGYPKFKVYTTNARLTALTGFMLDMDVTMLSGSRGDHFVILIKWPEINPLGIAGYEQPSDYYFLVFPDNMLVECYSKQEIKDLSVNKIPGYFLRRANRTCVKGVNSVNNVKVWFNPGIRFLVNDYELVNVSSDANLDYANRLIRDGAMAGATLQIVANSEDPYSRPVFQINRISVAVPK